MNSESINNEIFNSWKKTFKTEVANFEKEIITQFQNTFDDLDRAYQTRYSSLIDEKNKKISQLQNNFAKIQQFMNLIVGNKSGQQHMDVEQKKPIPEWRTTSKKKQIIIIDNEDSIKMEEERLQKFGQKKSNQNQREEIIEIEKSTERMEKLQSIEDHIVRSHSDHQIDQSSHQRARLRSGSKLLLQPRRNHLMWRVSLKPNFTRLNYIQYEPNNRKYSFSQVNIDHLQNYDISEVGSVKIQRQEMTDGTFDSLSRLSWNIASLQIGNIYQNFITNLNPLRNFQYQKLMHLDVSNNKLLTDSAQLLSTTKFDELIYLTLSFTNGPINQCWEILLKNGMENFPKLQAIDIYSANNLDESVKDKIIQCMRMKSAQQRSKAILNKDGRFERYYPQDYEIKIRWIDSKEVFDKQSIEFAQQNHKKWIAEVQYKCVPIKRQEQDNADRAPIRGRGRGRPKSNQQPQTKRRIIRKNKPLTKQ